MCVKYKKLQPGDVNNTYASIKLLQKKIDFVPNTEIQQGIENFINWYYKENKKSIHMTFGIIVKVASFSRIHSKKANYS